MGTVLAVGTGLRLASRRSKFLLLAIAIAAVGFVAPAGDASRVFASQIGTLNVTPAYTGLASTITACVFDPDLNVTVLREFESTDSTGNPYILPVGNAGDATIFKLQNSSVGDFNGDGIVTATDIQISTTKAVVKWVNKDAGTFQLGHSQTTSSTENFTVTYRSEHNDSTAITLKSPSDPVGFTLTLRETTPTSHTFEATFKTGSATSTTGATDATSSARPTIKVADGGTVTLEYSDVNPAKLISEALVIDATKPLVSITSPIHKSATSNTTAWARAVVTDSASGVEINQISFHIDKDRDGIFDEAGEIVIASITDSTAINQGWRAVALLPGVTTDGSVDWYVTATDRGLNTGRSDAEATVGNQNHKFTVDTSPPNLIEVVLGEAYDETAEKTVGNVLNSPRLKYSEPLKESLVDASRFFIEGKSAKTATMVTDIDDTVCLTFEDIPTASKLLTIMPGAVTDLTEFPSELREITPTDKLGPRLTVSTDTAITNGLLTIKVTTVETLAADPTVTINGVTFGSARPVGITEWSIVVDGNTFTGSAAGDGVKNVEAAGFDAASNIARGGIAIGASGYPTGAVQFHLDTVITTPVVVPGNREVAIVSNPLISVSFADELGEYAGDTHAGVTIVTAKLDGVDVTSGFTAESASTWSYRPRDMPNGEHTFEVVGRDDAGNTHSPIFRVFSVLAPPPTATPVPTETPTPAPTLEPAATSEADPTEPAATVVPGEAPATPDSTGTPEEATPGPEVTPEPGATVEPVPTPVPDVTPASGDSPAASDDASPTPDPEQVPTPEDTAAETPDATAESPPAEPDSSSPDGEEGAVDESQLTEDDLEATVAAMRADDDDEFEAEQEASLAPEPAYTVFGCNIPLSGEEADHAVSAGGDYIIAAAGLFGLIVARVVPRRKRKFRKARMEKSGGSGTFPSSRSVRGDEYSLHQDLRIQQAQSLPLAVWSGRNAD
jgi:hypothetical protein